MEIVTWVTVKNAEQFLRLIDLNSAGLEKTNELYKKGKFDEAVYEYYLFALGKFKKLNDTVGDVVSDKDILDADMILQNKIRLLGYDYIFAGDPIDWEFYPNNDKQWQNHLCYMYFPKSLLLAYEKTGDKQYVQKWNDIHIGFLKNHFYGNASLVYSKKLPMYKNEYLPVCGGEGFCKNYLGGSWISLAISRVEKWIEGMVYLAKKDLLDISVLCNLTASVIVEHLPVLFNNPRKGTPNQFIHISNILINIGIAFWEMKFSSAAYLVGMQWLEEAMDKYCILPDGTDLEQCTGYNSGITVAFYEIYNNADLRGNKRIQALYGKVLKRCEYLALVKDPLGYTPAMSKRQNKIMDRPYEDVEKYCKMYQDSDILTMVYDVFAKGEVSKKLPCSVDFPYGGYSVLRDGWTKDSMYAFMKYSRYAPGHKHEDSNAIVITAFGKRLLIDSGNYNYSDDTLSTEINNYMQSSAAHNTMDIDGLSQARLYIGRNIAVDERFPDSTTNDIEYEKYRKIISLHDAECEGRRIHTEKFDFVEGIYSDGYYNISSNDGFVEGKHIRRVLFIKGLGYIIDDELSVKDNDKHTFNQHWNFAEDFEPEDFVLGDNLIVAKRSDNVNIGIWNFTDGDMLYDTKYGSKEPVSGWCATEYGHMVKSVDITASLKKSKKVRIISFIYPFIGEKNYIKIIKHEPYYFEVLLKNKRLEIDSRDMKFDVKVNGETLRLN